MITVQEQFSTNLFQERFHTFEPENQINFADNFFNSPIEGHIEKWAAHVILRDITWLDNDEKWPEISQVTYDLLRFRGLDPDIVISLMTYKGTLPIIDKYDMDPAMNKTGFSFSLSSSRSIRWVQNEHMMILNLIKQEACPASALNAAVGQPLKYLLKHPALDQHDLIVESVDIANDKITLGKAQFLTADELTKRAVKKLKRKAGVRKVTKASNQRQNHERHYSDQPFQKQPSANCYP